jgi:hypothetical protein
LQFPIFADAKVQSWVGATVWDSAVRLSRYLDSSEAIREGLENRNVCEVGAGTGLVGLVAGALGANVTLTDVKSAHKHLQVRQHQTADISVCTIAFWPTSGHWFDLNFFPVLATRLILPTCSAMSTLIEVF